MSADQITLPKLGPDYVRALISALRLSRQQVATGCHAFLQPARVTTRPSSVLRSQPSARQSLSRRPRNAAQLPSSADQHPIPRDAAIEKCAQHRERAAAETGLLLNQAHSTRYLLLSSNSVSFTYAASSMQIGNGRLATTRHFDLSARLP